MNHYEKQLKRYETYLLLKNFSSRTREMYLRTIRSFYAFRTSCDMKSPLTEEQAGEYLLSRINAKKAWATINCLPPAARGSFASRCTAPCPYRDHSRMKILSGGAGTSMEYEKDTSASKGAASSRDIIPRRCG